MYKERIVIKVGTNVMTNRDNRIVRPVLRRLVKQIAELYERDIMTILVSSGFCNCWKRSLRGIKN